MDEGVAKGAGEGALGNAIARTLRALHTFLGLVACAMRARSPGLQTASHGPLSR